MKCNRCNYENSDTSKFCVNCGAKNEINMEKDKFSNNKKKLNQKTKKSLAITLVVIFLILLMSLVTIISLKKIFINNNNQTNLIQKEVTIKDEKLKQEVLITNDYINKKMYENIIYLPEKMNNTSNEKDLLIYEYKNSEYTLNISFFTYLDDESLKSFIEDNKFEKCNNYYCSFSNTKINVYIKTDIGYYIGVTFELGRLDSKEYKIDKNIINILNDIEIREVSYDKFSIESVDDYYNGILSFDYFNSKEEFSKVSVQYKVPASKYNSYFDKNNHLMDINLKNNFISFYEGEITKDINSINKQSNYSIELYDFVTSFDIDEEINNIIDLKSSVDSNQTAFINAKIKDVNIEKSTFKYNDYDVDYFIITADKNKIHNEIMCAFLKIKDNVYYEVKLFGGENKTLSLDILKEFLPVNIVMK